MSYEASGAGEKTISPRRILSISPSRVPVTTRVLSPAWSSIALTVAGSEKVRAESLSALEKLIVLLDGEVQIAWRQVMLERQGEDQNVWPIGLRLLLEGNRERVFTFRVCGDGVHAGRTA